MKYMNVRVIAVGSVVIGDFNGKGSHKFDAGTLLIGVTKLLKNSFVRTKTTGNF